MNSQVTKHANLFAYKFRDCLIKGNSDDSSIPKEAKNFEQHSHETVREIVFKEFKRMEAIKMNKFKFVDLSEVLD